MPSSETEHGHNEKVVSDKRREMFAIGKRRWRSESNRRIVVCKKRCLFPCRCARHGTMVGGVGYI